MLRSGWCSVLGVALVCGACGSKTIIEGAGTGGGDMLAGGGGGSGGAAGTAGIPTPCDGFAEAWVAQSADCGGRAPCYAVIQDAIDQVEAGTTVWVMPGSYTPVVSRQVVTATERLICLRSTQGAALTTLDGLGLGTVVIGGYKGALWIEGFTIRGAGMEDNAIVTDGYAVAMGGWKEFRGWVVNNVFEDNVLGEGALVFTGSNIEVEADMLIRGNVFRHNDAISLSSWATVYMDFPGPDGNSGVVRIENNIIADNGKHGLAFSQMLGFQPDVAWTIRIEVVNNTIVNNARGLIAPVDGIFVHNNIVAGNQDEDVWRLDEAKGTSVVANFFGVSPAFEGLDGNIGGDPLFATPAMGDYHLQPASPARNAGTPELAPPIDIEGTQRDPRHPDLGAFESP